MTRSTISNDKTLFLSSPFEFPLFPLIANTGNCDTSHQHHLSLSCGRKTSATGILVELCSAAVSIVLQVESSERPKRRPAAQQTPITAVTMESEGEALTAADLHLDDHHNDDDDDGTEYTDRTDDDSFFENSSLKKMMKNSLQMLDSLTEEMKEMTRGDNTSSNTVTKKKKTCGEGPTKPRISTPSSAVSGQGRFRDMTISVSFDSNVDRDRRSKASAATTPATESVLTLSSSPLASPLISPAYAFTMRNDSDAITIPTLDDIPTPKVDHDFRDHVPSEHDDDLSLDDSLANEMNALKQVALELERELQSTDSQTVQKAIERIGNSQDPKVKGILESEDKAIIRKILDEEIQRNEPENKLLRYLYRAVMNTLTEDETTHLLVASAVVVWAIVVGLIYRAMTVEVIA